MNQNKKHMGSAKTGTTLAQKKTADATHQPAKMKMIKPNCRVQFAAQDVEFILSVLGRKLAGADCLVQLLGDEDTRDLILDDDDLFHALLERGGYLRVTCHFYFYILVRHVFKRSDIADRIVADYVAEVLAEFAHAERARCVLPGQTESLDYFFDMLIALQTADDHTGFCLRAHIGNYSLFLAGVFPDWIREARAERRGFPGLNYYVRRWGARIFAWPGNTGWRGAMNWRAFFSGTIAERFETVRHALNDISDRLFSLNSVDDLALARLLNARANPT